MRHLPRISTDSMAPLSLRIEVSNELRRAVADQQSMVAAIADLGELHMVTLAPRDEVQR